MKALKKFYQKFITPILHIGVIALIVLVSIRYDFWQVIVGIVLGSFLAQTETESDKELKEVSKKLNKAIKEADNKLKNI